MFCISAFHIILSNRCSTMLLGIPYYEIGRYVGLDYALYAVKICL
jgi:hypothetical protein